MILIRGFTVMINITPQTDRHDAIDFFDLVKQHIPVKQWRSFKNNIYNNSFIDLILDSFDIKPLWIAFAYINQKGFGM